VTEAGITPTLFVMPDTPFSQQQAAAVGDLNIDIELHWNRFPLHLDGRGLHLNRLAHPAEQAGYLEDLFGKEITANRTHWLCLKGGADQHFETLAKAGFQADSTLGAYKKNQGPIFGSRYPYRRINAHDRPLDLWEFPFELYDPSARQFAETFRNVCLDNRQPLVLLLHPLYYLEGAGAETLRDILNLYREHASDVDALSLAEVISAWNELANLEWSLELEDVDDTAIRWRIRIPCWPAKLALEMPAGSILEHTQGGFTEEKRPEALLVRGTAGQPADLLIKIPRP
jgi:hypothetical protein